MTVIEKKIQAQYFQAIVDGKKTYELRLADFTCEPGDILLLMECDSEGKPTGRSLRKTVTYVGKTKDANFWSKEDIDKYGYQVIAFGSDVAE